MTSLCIWDSTYAIPEDLDPITWVENTLSSKDYASIFQIIEKNKDQFKTEYVNYIYELGKSEVNGESIENILSIKRLSYWWMTLISEKCNFSKSPQIDNLIKIIALKNKIIEEEIGSIKLYTHDKNLITSLECLADDLNIELHSHLFSSKKSRFKDLLVNLLPRIIQAIIWYISFFLRTRKINGIGKKEWMKSESELTFVTWSNYQDTNSLKKY